MPHSKDYYGLPGQNGGAMLAGVANNSNRPRTMGGDGRRTRIRQPAAVTSGNGTNGTGGGPSSFSSVNNKTLTTYNQTGVYAGGHAEHEQHEHNEMH